MSDTKRFFAFLNHPAVMILGIVLGFVIGIRFKNIAIAIAPFGNMYLAFLNMCILPIIVTSVISGLAKIIRSPEIAKRFPRIVFSFLLLLPVPGIVGVIAAVVGRPGKGLHESSLEALGGMMMGGAPTGSGDSGSIADFIIRIVPWNFFNSLSRGETMSIVFACIFIGLGTGVVKSKSADDLLAVIDAVSEVFNLLFKWAVHILPIGILCVIADQMKTVSLEIFGILANYIIIIYLTTGLLIVLYMILMWRVAGGTLRTSIKTMQAPLFLAFTTNSSFVTIKSCLDSLDEGLGIDRRFASLIVPFSMVANRQGKIFVFAFTSLFLSQLYGVDLSAAQYGTVIIGATLAGMAAPGSGPLLASSMIIVLRAINIPTALLFVIFTINGPIVDRVLSALTVQGSCLLASLSSGDVSKQKNKE